MKLPVTELYNWIETGSKITGDKDTDFFLYSKKGRLYLAFLNPQILYCKRFPVTGEIKDICLDLPIIRSMLKGKSGDLDIQTTEKSLLLKGKGFKYSLDGLNKIAPVDVVASFFTKKGDKTSFMNVTPKIVKALKSIQDRVSDSKLAVRVQGNGKTARFLLTDNHHGLLITQTLKESYKAEEIILPIDTFFKIIGVASSIEAVTFDQTDTDIVVQSSSEYLSCRMKATSNANISFEMMEGLLKSKSTGSCEIKTEELLQALSICKAIIESAPVVLSAEDNKLSIAMKTAFSKTAERINAKINKTFSVQLNVTLLMEIASAMFETVTLSIRNGNINLESESSNVIMQGMCVSYVEDDEDG